jgi:hypothetical protein
MGNTRLAGNRIVVLLTALSVAVGLTGLTTTAVAGSGHPGGSGGKHKHHHKKKCPQGFHKEVVKKNGKVVKKKNGKPKKKCVKNHNGTSGSSAAKLSIDPGTFTFPDTQHHSGLPCPACPTQDFTVKNSGGSASGTLTPSVTDVADPNPGDDPAFLISQNGCGAALPPGGTCSITVTFSPPSNGGDQHYASVLHVRGSPGGDAQAQMSGDAD